MRVLLSFFLWFISTFVAFAQESQFGYTLPKKQYFAKIPFELVSNLIIVPVFINQSDTLRFILDTGVSATILTDPVTAAKVGLSGNREVGITGTGSGGELKAKVSVGNTIRMGDMTGHSQNIVVLQEDLLNLSEFVGVPIHGIFGYEIFNRFVVTIDFLTREIILQLPEKYKYRARRNTMRFPIEVEETKPYFTGISVPEYGKNKPMRVLIDTGAGHCLSLESTKEQRFTLPERRIGTQLGRGLSGNVSGYLGRVKEIKVGNLTLKDPVVSFPDSISMSARLFARAARQGTIGCELLRRFKVTFNYSEHYMTLKPIKVKIKEPFEHNMTGMELLAKGVEFKDLYISKIDADSPADNVGLVAGDQLMFINEKSVKRLLLNDVYKLFQKGDSKDLTMLVKRGESVFVVVLKLKRQI